MKVKTRDFCENKNVKTPVSDQAALWLFINCLPDGKTPTKYAKLSSKRDFHVAGLLMSVWKGFDGVVMKFVITSSALTRGRSIEIKICQICIILKTMFRKLGQMDNRSTEIWLPACLLWNYVLELSKKLCKPTPALNTLDIQSQQCCLSAESPKRSINLRKQTSARVEAESVKDESLRAAIRRIAWENFVQCFWSRARCLRSLVFIIKRFARHKHFNQIELILKSALTKKKHWTWRFFIPNSNWI